MNDYITVNKAIARPITISFFIIWDIIVVYKLIQNPQYEYKYIFIGIVIFVTGFILRQLFAKLKIVVSEKTLFVKYTIFAIPFRSKTFVISEIKYLYKECNVKENSGWFGNGFWLYDTTPVILSFIYLNKRVEIGKTFSLTETDELIKEIGKRH
jgi:hypothetical protein